MSGGGNPIHNTSGGNSDDCVDLWFSAKLASPIRSVVDKLNEGDILEIAIIDGSVTAIAKSGDVAGALTSRDTIRLKKCLETGHDFIAKVIKVDGGSCDVIVKCAHQ